MNATFRRACLAALLTVAAAGASPAQEARISSGSAGVTIDFVNTDLRAVVQALAQYLDRPVIFGQIAAAGVTFQSATPVPPGDIPALLRTLLASQGHEMVEEGGAYLVRQRAAPVQQLPVPVPGPGRAAPGGPVELYVLRLRHARAADVAATVNALYGRASALGELGAPRRESLDQQLRENRIPPYGADPQQGAAVVAGRDASFQGNVVIVPDPRTNSLMVRASEHDYALIRAAVEQLDIRPLQVVVEVTIAEIRRNSGFDFGLSSRVTGARVRGSDNTTVGGEVTSPGVGDLVIDILNIGGIDLDLTLTAGERRGAVDILSRPVVFAANNEQAEIMVGDQRPFIQVQRSTDGGVLDQVVQYKDVGTRLLVVPTISEDGYVHLEVAQEVNNATEGSGLQGAPVISTRSVSTTLLVRDGQTAVLGGLSQALRERNSRGVPYLSDIPLVGWVFGGKSRTRDDTELFVFLTPRVVRDDAELEAASGDVRENSDVGRLMRRAKPLVLPSPKDAPEAGEAPVERP